MKDPLSNQAELIYLQIVVVRKINNESSDNALNMLSAERKPTLTKTSLIVIFLLAGMAAVQILPVMLPISNAQSQSCPASDTLHITFYGGVPSNFNILGHYNPAGFFTTYLQDITGTYPIETPTGIVLNDTTAASSVTANSNYSTWTIKIKNLTWSNGQVVSAQDYIQEWSPNFALNPQYDAIGIHSEVTSVTALNNSAVQFKLNQTDAQFADKIASIFDTVLFPQQFTANGGAYNGLTNSSVGVGAGLGPFVVSNYSPGQSQMIMVRNPYFQPQPKICELVWNFVESETGDAIYIASGSSDLAPVDPQSAVSLISTDPHAHIIEQPDVLISYIGYNTSDYPYNMTNFRQALVFGINQTQITQKAYQGYAASAYAAEGSIPSDSRLYNPSQVKYNFNQTEALSLLHAIGFTGGGPSTPLLYPNGTAVSLTLWGSEDVASDSIIAGFVKSDLSNLGISLSLQLTSYSTIVGYLTSNGNNILNEMTLHSSNALYPADPYYMAQEAPLTYGLTEPTYRYYMYPPNINTQYQSNLTAITGTASPTLEAQYLNNIQSLYAQYLPELNLAYADNLYAYSDLHFTGWPGLTGYIQPPYTWNYTALETLSPVTGATTSTTTTPSSTTGSGVVTTTTSSTTTGSGISFGTELAIVAAVIIIIVGSGLYFVLRRRK